MAAVDRVADLDALTARNTDGSRWWQFPGRLDCQTPRCRHLAGTR